MFSHIRQIYSDKVPPLLAQRVYPSIAVGRSPFSRLKADLRAIMRGSRPCQPAGRQVLGHCGGRNVDFRCELLRLRTVSFREICPCRPVVASRPPSGPGWAHELDHDGYRLQIHVGDGRVHLHTRNGADWSKRYPRIVAAASRIKGSAIIDAEAVYLDAKGRTQFHSRLNDHVAIATAFAC